MGTAMILIWVQLENHQVLAEFGSTCFDLREILKQVSC